MRYGSELVAFDLASSCPETHGLLINMHRLRRTQRPQRLTNSQQAANHASRRTVVDPDPINNELLSQIDANDHYDDQDNDQDIDDADNQREDDEDDDDQAGGDEDIELGEDTPGHPLPPSHLDSVYLDDTSIQPTEPAEEKEPDNNPHGLPYPQEIVPANRTRGVDPVQRLFCFSVNRARF